jgi:uncharacterized membrane protein YsdA (DUF1294 family)/cold shock CspA family protein
MRYQGKLSDWRDDKGFGFVTPNGGGQRAFVHITAFSNKKRRPLGNEIVTYEIAFDPTGRAMAENITFFGERQRAERTVGQGGAPLVFGALFFLVMGAAVAIGKMPLVVPGFYLAASAVTFIAYAIDKSAAQGNRWRTPESTLQMFALAGGWPGALAAQYVLRHKLKKPSFMSVFWATVAMNFGALCWLLLANDAVGFRATIGF